jgi:hypothetical protein
MTVDGKDPAGFPGVVLIKTILGRARGNFHLRT